MISIPLIAGVTTCTQNSPQEFTIRNSADTFTIQLPKPSDLFADTLNSLITDQEPIVDALPAYPSFVLVSQDGRQIGLIENTAEFSFVEDSRVSNSPQSSVVVVDTDQSAVNAQGHGIQPYFAPTIF